MSSRLVVPWAMLGLITTTLAALGGPAAAAPTPQAVATQPSGAPAAAPVPGRHPTYAVSMDRALRLRASGPQQRSRPWPVAGRVGETVEDTDVHPSAAPAQQLAAARLEQDLVRSTVSATIRLRGTPTAASNAWVLLAFGTVTPDGEYCTYESESAVYWSTFWDGNGDGVNDSTTGLLREGDRSTLVHFPGAAFAADRYNCAFAETWRIEPEDAAEPWQVLFSGRGAWSLAPVFDTPELKTKAPRQVRVEGRRWATVSVKVRNTNPRVAAPKVKVTVEGRRITATTVRLGTMRPGVARRATVRLRVAPGATKRAKILVRTRDVTARRTLRIR